MEPVGISRRTPSATAATAGYLRLPGLFLLFLVLAVLFAVARPVSAEPTTIRVAVLQYGTVSWELEVVRSRDLDREHGVRLEVLPLASENALAVALQGGRVDMIVADWLWAARQRANGNDYRFAPYSNAVGAVMVDPDAGIEDIADLQGRELGVAGGATDKTWLLLRAYAQKSTGLELDDKVEPQFAAPPMINRLMLTGQLPAAVNYWHYNARLKAAGMRPLLTLEDILAGLGVETVPPLLGWVFRAEWARENREALQGFLAASFTAKRHLAENDQTWEWLRPSIRPENDAVLAAIRAGYRAGIPSRYGPAEIEAAAQVFRVLSEEGGTELTGALDRLPRDVFWDGFRLP